MVANASADASPPEVRCARVTAETAVLLEQMLAEANVSVGGVVSSRLQGALVRDAARDSRRVIGLVATEDGGAAGFLVSTLDSRRYWKGVMARSPFAAAHLLWDRLRRRVAARSVAHASTGGTRVPGVDATYAALPPAEQSEHAWSDEGPDVARIVFVGVRSAFRRRGVGELLYREFMEEAARRGARLGLARIAADNLSSIRLHLRTGWQLFRDGEGILAVHPLPSPDHRQTQG